MLLYLDRSHPQFQNCYQQVKQFSQPKSIQNFIMIYEIIDSTLLQAQVM